MRKRMMQAHHQNAASGPHIQETVHVCVYSSSNLNSQNLWWLLCIWTRTCYDRIAAEDCPRFRTSSVALAVIDTLGGSERARAPAWLCLASVAAAAALASLARTPSRPLSSHAACRRRRRYVRAYLR